MVKNCCVRFCKSESYGGCGISFHSFPKNEETNQKWLDLVLVSQKITKNSVVCSLHFQPEDFYTKNSRQFLKADAIPSIFPLPKNKQINVISAIVIQQPMQTVESSLEDYTPPVKKLCPSVKNLGTQTEIKNKSPSKDTLRRKVKVLSQRLKRRDIKLDN